MYSRVLSSEKDLKIAGLNELMAMIPGQRNYLPESASPPQIALPTWTGSQFTLKPPKINTITTLRLLIPFVQEQCCLSPTP
ncbi:hypothetical protein NPIL_20371 [Nephila pilipes]|uniref:Uncharacterized protein n=1 Tax=Nephila pilipes TaxID=299642 RepID=A0A8X6NZW4_NEPPI|nr:hypothetical protein NPIL_20371 [Nephila pilipes]